MSKKTKPTSGPSDHSRISPSGLKSLKLCPGYEGMESEEGLAAKRGTFLHAIMEKGELPPTPWPTFTRASDVELSTTLLKTVAEVDANSTFDPLTEVSLDFTQLKLQGFEKGTVDRLVILDVLNEYEPLSAQMIDFKFGAWKVDDIRDNLQFKAYALGVFDMFPSLEILEVRCIQPECEVDEVVTFTRDRDYRNIRAQVIAVVKSRIKWLETRDPSMLASSPDNCTFCASQATCPIWQAYMVKLANESKVLEAPVMAITDLDSPETADPEEVVRVYRWIKPMEEYLRKLKKFALAAYDTGHVDKEQMRLVEKKGSVEVLDVLFVKDYLRANYGVTDEEFVAACDIGVTKIGTLVASHVPAGTKAAAQQEVLTHLSEEGILSYGSTVRYVQLKR